MRRYKYKMKLYGVMNQNLDPPDKRPGWKVNKIFYDIDFVHGGTTNKFIIIVWQLSWKDNSFKDK